jgi:hypothetical protein
MLRKIVAEFQQNSKALCLEELSQRLSIEPGALEGMLQMLVRKGRLLEIDFGHNNACSHCPARGGCMVIGRLGKGYLLAQSPAN